MTAEEETAEVAVRRWSSGPWVQNSSVVQQQNTGPITRQPWCDSMRRYFLSLYIPL